MTPSFAEVLDQIAYAGSSEHAQGWAWLPRVEDAVRLLELSAEKRRRDGVEPPPKTPARRLWALQFTRWVIRYAADGRRQRAVAEKLGIEWPPTPHLRLRPFVWCWEPQPRAEIVPVAYPCDWDAGRFPDLYGSGGEWRPGETLVLLPDDVPVDAELVDEPTHRRVPPRQPAAPHDALAIESSGESHPVPALEPPAPRPGRGLAPTPGLDSLAVAIRQLNRPRQ